MEGDKTTNEGLCIKCAMEMNIGPIKQMMDNMGITEDQLDDMNEQMEQMMESMGEEGFEPGGASTFPFLQNMGLMPMDVPDFGDAPADWERLTFEKKDYYEIIK